MAFSLWWASLGLAGRPTLQSIRWPKKTAYMGLDQKKYTGCLSGPSSPQKGPHLVLRRTWMLGSDGIDSQLLKGKKEVKRRADEKAQRQSKPRARGDPSPSRRLRLPTSRTTMAAPSPSTVEAAPPLEDPAADEEEDEWDADGYVIPNLLAQDSDVTEPSIPIAKDPEPLQAKDEKIYLGPHGAPPSQAKQQELNTIGRKQQFRNKLKEADRKFTGNAQENKVESLRELMGARASGTSMPKSSPRDWLDPHCHESEFDRKPTR